MNLSDINLLPQKEKISVLFIISVALIVFVTLIGGAFLAVYYNSLDQKLVGHKSKLESVIKQREKEEKRIIEGSSVVNASQRFENLIKVVDSYPVPTMEILNQFSSLLPRQGSITSYSYTDQGNINITGEFKTLDEVAAYMHWLTASDWIIKVDLPTVSGCSCTENEKYTALYNISLNRDAFLPKKGEMKK
jgi:Tfp pilus assembly protein PilN